jgi:hypothetical protein
MSIYRKTVSFSQQIAIDRRYNGYVLGGNWNPFERWVGTDCSGCVIDMTDAAISGTAMQWRRNADDGGGSTEDWRPPSLGGGADPTSGPFGTVMVDDPSQFPSDAAVLIALHHGDGSAEDSHMWCQIDQLAVETHGSCDQFHNGATVLNSRDSELFNDNVLSVYDTSYANNWWYLATGPIIEDGTPIPTGASPVVSQPLDALARVGLPRMEGQKRYQDNHVATAVRLHHAGGALGWAVRNLHTGNVTYTKRLAHVSHWKVTP